MLFRSAAGSEIEPSDSNGSSVFSRAAETFWSWILGLPRETVRWAGLLTGLLLLTSAFLLHIPRNEYIRFLEAVGLRKKTIVPVGFFNDILVELEKRHIHIKPGETAAEFVTRINLPVSREDALFLAEQYYRIRYGGRAIGDPERTGRLVNRILGNAGPS